MMEVKGKKRGRPAKQEIRLEKQKIIQIAQELTLSEGKVPSIRRLASELTVDPMAIYHYFSSKTVLFEAVSISLIGDLYVPNQDFNWRENLRNLSRSYLSLLLNYPGLIEIILSGPSEGAANLFINRLEDSIRELYLDSKTIKNISDLLVDYIHGFAYASACNQTDNRISIDLADGPLNYLFDRIEVEK